MSANVNGPLRAELENNFITLLHDYIGNAIEQAMQKLVVGEPKEEERWKKAMEEVRQAKRDGVVPSMEIVVKTFTGGSMTLLICYSPTVDHVMCDIEDTLGLEPKSQVLHHNGQVLKGGESLAKYGIVDKSKLQLAVPLRDGKCTAYQIHGDLFDDQYNYDFTNIRDNGQFYRGGYLYKRPLGSMRYAIKVLGRYSDDNWLGHNKRMTRAVIGEWPVAYHGTTDPRAAKIVKTGGLKVEEGKRFNYGMGIYCTPDPATALAYSEEYTHEGQSYKLIFQVRVDPARMKVVSIGHYFPGYEDFWLALEDDAIRPYGICVFPMP